MQDKPWWYKTALTVAVLTGGLLFVYTVTGGYYEAGLFHWVIAAYVVCGMAVMTHDINDK